jgi:spoIIIJ-associated protein
VTSETEDSDVTNPQPTDSETTTTPDAAAEPVSPSSRSPAEEARVASSTDVTGALGSTRASSAGDLDEGEIAADYIEELLDICDFDGDIDIEVRAGRSYISVDSTGEGNLRVLSKPDTVNALQELTRIAVQTKTGEFSRLILDIGGSRAIREAELGALVDRAVEKLEEGGTAAALPPMSSYERKLVHDIVAARGFTSESEGEGRDRHTVITRA